MHPRANLLAALIVCPLLAEAGHAQISHSLKTWSRTLGGSSAAQGLFDLRQLPSGRVAVAGYSGSFGGSGHAGWLLHLDVSDGDVRFERVSNSSGGITDGAALAADGGALFLGRNVVDIFNKHDAWISRVDPSGNAIWSQGFTRSGFGRHFLFDAAELDDGSWIAVGATSIVDQPPQAAWLVRLTARGVPMWHYEYSGGITETARSVTPTSDGGFVVAGWSNSSGAGSDDVWVMKTDGLGAIQWQKTYGSFDAEQAEEIVELADGGFAVAGYSNSLTHSGHAPWVLRLDPTGTLLWQRVVDDGVWGDLGAVAQTQDGQLIVVGRVGQPGFPTNDLWAAKLAASDGSVLWQRAYGGDSGDFGSNVLTMQGSGFVLGGTWGWGFPDESIWLQRCNPAGGLSGCGIVRETGFALTGPAVAVSEAVTVRAVGGAMLQTVAIQEAGSEAQVVERCR